MKKFFALILALILSCSIAFADCSCVVDPAVRLTAFQIGTLTLDFTSHEMHSIAALATDSNGICDCSEIKIDLIHIMMRNMTTIVDAIGEVKLELLLEYIAHCGCCDTEANEETAVEEAPIVVKPVHYHRGGTHTNGGKCVECYTIYQNHTTVIKSVDNNCHAEKCNFCGWEGEKEIHKAGELIEVCSNGLGHYKCVVCSADLYWHILRDWEIKTNCCDCHCAPCCENCGCGCTHG